MSLRVRFCAVRLVSTCRWRPRDLKACLDELEQAKQILTRLKHVKISDDAPTVNRRRFKEFLRGYIRRRIGLHMIIDNLRADSVDEELVDLARRAENHALCVAVEHGHPEVFAFMNKGKTLEEIERAAQLNSVLFEIPHDPLWP
ncbi:MAG: radical SAM protein [Candidatus Binatia bacterium]